MKSCIISLTEIYHYIASERFQVDSENVIHSLAEMLALEGLLAANILCTCLPKYLYKLTENQGILDQRYSIL